MKITLQITGSVALLALAGFAVFGFLASFEPSASSRLPWQIAYAVLGLASLSGVILFWRPRDRG